MASERLRRSFLLLSVGVLQLGLAACGSIPTQFKSIDRADHQRTFDARDRFHGPVVVETEPQVRFHADAERHFRHARDPQWLLVQPGHGTRKDVAYWSSADFVAMRAAPQAAQHASKNDPRALNVIAVRPTLAEPLAVHFEFDSARLTPAALRSIGQWLSAHRPSSLDSVKVIGHTDAIGTDPYNKALSVKRARVVAAAIEDGGVDATRIEVFGKGEAEPAASNATPEGRAANRRVNVQATLRAASP